MKILVCASCLTLCYHRECSPPGSSVHGILQARILEWIAIPFSRGTSQPKDQTLVSCLAGRFFIIWATGKSYFVKYIPLNWHKDRDFVYDVHCNILLVQCLTHSQFSIWRRKWQPTPVYLPGKSHGQTRLVGYSLWGRKTVEYDLAIKQQKQVSNK